MTNVTAITLPPSRSLTAPIQKQIRSYVYQTKTCLGKCYLRFLLNICIYIYISYFFIQFALTFAIEINTERVPLSCITSHLLPQGVCDTMRHFHKRHAFLLSLSLHEHPTRCWNLPFDSIGKLHFIFLIFWSDHLTSMKAISAFNIIVTASKTHWNDWQPCWKNYRTLPKTQ